MPRTEACYIAMHLANSECADGRVDDMDEVMRTLSSIDEVTNIVGREFSITADRASYNYARFASPPIFAISSRGLRRTRHLPIPRSVA